MAIVILEYERIKKRIKGIIRMHTYIQAHVCCTVFKSYNGVIVQRDMNNMYQFI